MSTLSRPATAGEAAVAVGRLEFYGYFLRLGATGFGGPIALAGFMQRDLVDERKWIAKQDYLDGLALAQLAPGPLAAQLAMYLGYVHSGVVGATMVSACFIVPSFVMVRAISVAYVQFGGLPWMQGLFYRIGAAVIGIIARSAFKLTTLTLKRRPLLWAIFAAMAIATAWTEREIAWLFVAAGVVTTLPLLSRQTAGPTVSSRHRGRAPPVERPPRGAHLCFRVPTSVRLDEADHDIEAALSERVRVLQHREGLADTRGSADVDAHAGAPVASDAFQPLFRCGAARHERGAPQALGSDASSMNR